jgi:hypothetical protein
MTAEAQAHALRSEWARLLDQREALALAGSTLEDCHDLAALRAHAERLRAHGEELRAFVEAMNAYHALPRRATLGSYSDAPLNAVPHSAAAPTLHPTPRDVEGEAVLRTSRLA